jgi:hypothetical protein
MAESISIRYIPQDFSLTDLGHPAWNRADEAIVTTYWSGEQAPAGRHFAVRMLWSDAFLYSLFIANQNEPLVVAAEPDTTRKTIGLWERDVCEIFIAPDPSRVERYFEFEVAPTGEWLDLRIEADAQDRKTHWEYISGVETAAEIGLGTLRMALKVPFASLGAQPKSGDEWRGGLFRCVGSGPDRGYLSWQSTLTEIPNFHVPSSFGTFVFDR